MPLPPIVSVVIAAGNSPTNLELTLRSVRAQTFPSVEVLVAPVTRTGIASAWNASLRRCTSRFVCCLVSGDQLAPTYLEKLLFRLQISGEDASASLEEPQDELPHIYSFQRRVMAAGFDETLAATDARVALALSAGRRGLAVGLLPEILAVPADGPLKNGEAALRPRVGAQEGPRLSYVPLLHKSPAVRTILLAMPFIEMGGAEAVLSQICKQLKDLGFRILIYTTVPLRADQEDATAWFEESAFAIYDLPAFLDAADWATFVAYLIQQHSVSVLWQAGSSWTYEWLAAFRELFPRMAVVDLLFNPVGHTADYLRSRHLIDHAIIEHDGMKQWLLDRGETNDRVSVIPNGVDLMAFSPQPRLDWRTRLPRATDDPRCVVAFIGRLSEEKAPDVFLKIAHRLAVKAEFEFLICGLGPMEPALRRELKALGLENRIDFLGFVRSRDILPCCDISVVCSRIDGRPNLIMESLAMGVPVVASRVGGIPGIMPTRELLCEPGNADEFATAIQGLAEDTQRYRQAARAARSYAQEKFSVVGSGQRYARLFEELHLARAGNCEPEPEVIAAHLGYGNEVGVDRPPLASRHSSSASSIAGFASHLRNALLWLRVTLAGRTQIIKGCFDEHYYRKQARTSALLRYFPLIHYVFVGFRERRNPSASFDTFYYLSINSDILRAGINPLLHFAMWGAREGRQTRPRYRSNGPRNLSPQVREMLRLRNEAHGLPPDLTAGRERNEAAPETGL